MGAEKLIQDKLEETRRRLLDLTRANRLLNHRCKGQRTLEIADEPPRQVYEMLVENGTAMQFLSREEAPPEIADKLPREEDSSGTTADSIGLSLAPISSDEPTPQRRADRKLQTLLTGEKLQSRLVFLARESASALEEQGYNILYLTLGIVHWQEAGGQGPICRAPLVFVPVELRRKNVQSRHSLSLFDDDILVNPCLAELCQRQFAFELPAFDPESDASLDDYFAAVRQKIAELPGWRFTSEIHLGLFSFSKLLMYRDLEDKNWPDGAKLTQHRLIRQLAGVDEPAAHAAGDGIPDPATLDDAIHPNDCFQVLDADSSQQAAIIAAKRGLDLVIDGPPGTGKSQTITNVIAECLAGGKTVLFVAEKSAALEVVKRRLENVGLGDFILELHSRKSSRRSVLAELQRTLSRESAAAPPASEVEAEQLRTTRSRLNEYQRQLHQPLGALGISPYRAIGHAIALSEHPQAGCQIPDPLKWTAAQLAEAQERLQSLDRRLSRVGDPSRHPWKGAGIVPRGIEAEQKVRASCDRLTAAIRALLDHAAALAILLETRAPITPQAIESLLVAAKTIAAAPRLTPEQINDPRSDAMKTRISAFLKAGAAREQRRSFWARVMFAEAEALDWRDVLARRDAQKSSLLRWLRPSWYADGKLIRSYLVNPAMPDISQQLLVLRSLIASAQLRKTIEEHAAQFGDLFGPAWRGPDSSFAELRRIAEAIAAIRQLINTRAVGADAARRFAAADDRAALIPAIAKVDTSSAEAVAAFRAWLEAIHSDEPQWLGSPWKQADLPAQLARLSPLPSQMDRLGDWSDLRSSIAECSASPLASFAQWAVSPAAAEAGQLPATFLRHFYRLWIDRALAERPALRSFRGEDHQALIERFVALDLEWLDASKRRLGALIASRRPDMNHAAHRQSKLGIVQAEIRKKARHMPLRKLLAAAGDVVQSIKPCFMMSPLSVAQYLSPGCINFDVVIFDEASQVEPADAYGAIARARQLLLVGDENQLPPTRFFSRVDQDQPAEDDDEAFVATDLESILGLGIVRMAHRACLRWHYRSRHASLIEFSNARFYDGRLRVFPSPHTDRSELGLSFRFVEGGVYRRGGARDNPIEARFVAREAIRHAFEHPNLSLGVGTLNLAQQRAIEDEIERLRRQSPDQRVEDYFASHPHEPFFVKNLENLQGDERDVIFLSVGYGKDANGRMTAGFGPLNADGGWRRLNVLVTRARRQCIVFSSIHADDIDLGGTQARGVVALKDFLFAAENGRLADTPAPGGDHDSDFEADVCRALRQKGWEVHAQVGAAGFAIDLAVVDPARPGKYLLGIECDGATYHSSPTARDRDRLRQEVLENLGWQIHRVWSTDWFHRRAVALEAILKRLNEAKNAPRDQPAPPPPPPPSPAPPAAAAPQNGTTSTSPPQPPPPPPETRLPEGVVEYPARSIRILGDQADLLRLAPTKLADILCGLVAAEAPIHQDEAMRVIAEMFSTRTSARSREAFDRALSAAISAGRIARKGEFLWHKPSSTPLVRYRGNSCPVTRPELIAPEEFEQAIRLVLAAEFGLTHEALAASTARLMGFARSGANLRASIESAIARLIRRGDIQADHSGFLVLKPANGA